MKKAVSILSVCMLCVIEIMTSFSYAVTSQVLVTFDLNEGSEVEGIEVEYGQRIEAPVDPTRDGYEFKGWAVEESNYVVRYLERDTEKVLDDDVVKSEVPVGATVVENPKTIDGYFVVSEDPKSIVINRDESQNIITFYYFLMPHYKVTYVVNEDPEWKAPEDFEIPTDETKYAPGETVDVKPRLTTEVNYAYNDKGEKILGTWTFTPWDKDDFQIYEDTTITGGWTFTPDRPAPVVSKYKYVVHYVLWEDFLNGKTTKVADDKEVGIYEEVELDELEITVTEPAKTGDDLKAKYRRYYQPVPGYESVTKTITGGNYDNNGNGYHEIYIYYKKKASSSAVNPNSRVVTYEVTQDPAYGQPNDVTVPAKKAYTKGDTVEVAEILLTAQDYAILDGERVPGIWTFIGWDITEDFVIDENTTITGGWKFEPAPEEELKAAPEEESEAPEELTLLEALEEPEELEISEEPELEEIIEEPIEELLEELEELQEIIFGGMVGNTIGELLGDPEGNYRYWDFENDEFNYDTKLIAVWEPITYTISYEGVDGLENSNPTEYTVETEAFDLIPLEKSGYTFEGWYTSEGNKVSQVVEGSTGNLVLTAKRTQNGPRYSGGGGSHRSKATKTEDTHGAAKKSEDKATVIDEVKEVVSDKVAEKTTENNVDKKEELKAEESTEDFNDSYVTYVEPKETLDSDISNKSELGNTAEMVKAYNFAYEHGITTKETFEDADTDGLLNRKELAKMLSQFAINVMGMEPEEGKAGCESFNDTKRESPEMKGYMKSACELGLMGLESDGITVANHFDPNKSVTRAEFGTTLSRLLYGGVNNLHDDLDRRNNEWYEKHLRALQDNGIMTQVSGEWVKKIELRGYVMLMLMRTSQEK